MENANNTKKMNNENLKNNTSNKMTNAVTKPSPEREPEALGALYRVASRNLREYHGVPSMSQVNLKNTMALLQLCPSRLVARGLAPQRLLKSEWSPALQTPDSWEDDEGETYESAAGGMLRGVVDDIDSSNSEAEPEGSKDTDGEKDADDSDSTTDNDSKGDVNKENSEVCGASGKGTAKRPIHAALVAGGIKLRPRETRPLLRALGVSPHRLVRLGLVEREALRGTPTNRRGRDGHQLGGGCGQGHRGGGMGRPRGPPHGPPPACRCGPVPGCGPSRPMHGPPPPIHGPGHHGEDVHGEGNEDNMYGPHDLEQHGPRHLERRRGGPHGPPHGPHRPGRHDMPRPGRGPPGDRMHSPPPPPPHGPGHYGEYLHSRRSGEEGMLMHGGPLGPHHGSGPIGRHRGGMDGHGPPGRMHDPAGPPPPPPHGPPRRHHGTACGLCEQAMQVPSGAGHHDGPVCEGPRPMLGFPAGQIPEKGKTDELPWRMAHPDHSRPHRNGGMRGRDGGRGRPVLRGGGHRQHGHMVPCAH